MISENQTHINMFIFTLMQSNTNPTNTLSPSPHSLTVHTFQIRFSEK